MVGERIMWALCLWAAGFVSAVIVGARNGEQMAAGVADVLDTCDDMARADLLAMVHNGRAVVRRGQHRVWEASEDGRQVWWQPDPKSSRCEVALAGPDAAVRMISAALRGLKSFRPGRTDAGVYRHPRRLLGGGL